MAFGIVWQVETHKGEQSIVARAETESEAWAIAGAAGFESFRTGDDDMNIRSARGYAGGGGGGWANMVASVQVHQDVR